MIVIDHYAGSIYFGGWDEIKFVIYSDSIKQ